SGQQMLSKLGALWDELDRDLTCRCIILTGVGQRAFTVGADISGDLSAGPESGAHGEPRVAEKRRLFEADRRRGAVSRRRGTRGRTLRSAPLSNFYWLLKRGERPGRH